MLVATAAATVVFGDLLRSASREGLVPTWAPLAPPAAFTLFVVVYTLDRWFLVRHRGYAQSRALMQVAFALVFLTLLLQPQAPALRALRPEAQRDAAALVLLAHPESEVRRAACDVACGQVSAAVVARVEALADSDPAAAVRDACGRALGRLSSAAPAGGQDTP